MTTRPVLLLDDGGVMNDNRLRGEQWAPLVGEFFAPRLGGAVSAWADANSIVMQDILKPNNWLAVWRSCLRYYNRYKKKFYNFL